jgi:hypothetical protein
MPLEIQEISIGMQVSGAMSPAQAPGAGGERPGGSTLDREMVIKECVRRVLLALKELGER